eukprot:1065180-Amphidinium_carterae.1
MVTSSDCGIAVTRPGIGGYDFDVDATAIGASDHHADIAPALHFRHSLKSRPSTRREQQDLWMLDYVGGLRSAA